MGKIVMKENNIKNKKIGFTIGKFAPLHKGHQFLIFLALNEMDKVIVVVYDTDVIDVSTEKRAEWIKSIYPEVEIRLAHNPPSKYGLDDESVNIQMEYLYNIIGNEKVTHFYSSEEYGAYVAKYMNIVDRRVDNKRIKVPIHASQIRNSLENNKEWVHYNVYNDLNN